MLLYFDCFAGVFHIYSLLFYILLHNPTFVHFSHIVKIIRCLAPVFGLHFLGRGFHKNVFQILAFQNCMSFAFMLLFGVYDILRLESLRLLKALCYYLLMDSSTMTKSESRLRLSFLNNLIILVWMSKMFYLILKLNYLAISHGYRSNGLDETIADIVLIITSIYLTVFSGFMSYLLPFGGRVDYSGLDPGFPFLVSIIFHFCSVSLYLLTILMNGLCTFLSI